MDDMSNTRKEIAARLGFASEATNARPSKKHTMGILDRLGTAASAAVSAATAKPFDPTSPQLAKDLDAAKKVAISEVNNYKFMVDFNDAQFKALDDYVKATAKSISGLRSPQDVARLTEGIKQAVAARNLIRKTLKTPFAKKNAKGKFAAPKELSRLRTSAKAFLIYADTMLKDARAIAKQPIAKSESRRIQQLLSNAANLGNEAKRFNSEVEQLAQSSATATPEENRKAVAYLDAMYQSMDRDWKSQLMELGDLRQRNALEIRQGARKDEPRIAAWVNAIKQGIKATKQAYQDTPKSSTRAREDYQIWLRHQSALLDAVQRGDARGAKREIGYLIAEGYDMGAASDIPRDLVAWANGMKASRPGVKARFDSNQVAFFLDALASQVIDQKDLAKKNAQSAADYVFKHGTDEQIKRFVQLAERVGLRVNMSRPGAKVAAGRAEDLYRKLSSGSITYANAKEWERLVTEALRLPDYTPPGGDMSLHEIAEDLGGDLMALETHSGPEMHAKATMSAQQTVAMDEAPETEDVKAGLKLIAASDEAVSDKIRKLMKEGKPQDQAVAIALDMKRRGEI